MFCFEQSACLTTNLFLAQNASHLVLIRRVSELILWAQPLIGPLNRRRNWLTQIRKQFSEFQSDWRGSIKFTKQYLLQRTKCLRLFWTDTERKSVVRWNSFQWKSHNSIQWKTPRRFWRSLDLPWQRPDTSFLRNRVFQFAFLVRGVDCNKNLAKAVFGTMIRPSMKIY